MPEDNISRFTRVTIKHSGHEYEVTISIYATEDDKYRIMSSVYQAMRKFHQDMQQVSDTAMAQRQLIHTILDRYPQTRTDPEVMKWMKGEFNE